MHRVVPLTIITLCIGFAARSEETPKLTVNSVGSVKLSPTALEVVVALKEKGESTQSAVDALKALRDKVAAKFKDEFKVPADGIKDDELNIVDAEQMNRMKQQMRMRSSGGRLKKAKDDTAKKPEVEVGQFLRARVPLAGKDSTALTLEAEDIKAKVKAVLTSVIEKPKAEEGKEDTGENPEADMEEMMQQQNGGATGPFSFAFFAPRGEDNYNKALADALQKAKESSARMAKVMGKSADVHSVVVQTDGSEERNLNPEYYDSYGGYGRYGYGRQQMAQPSTDGITSTTPVINMYARISVEFFLK